MLSLEEYYDKKQKRDKQINKLKKLLRQSNKTIGEQQSVLQEKRDLLENTYGYFEQTDNNYSVTIKNKTYNTQREYYIGESYLEKQLYEEINNIKEKIIVTRYNNLFEYTNEDESMDNFENLQNDLKEKTKIHDDLIAKIRKDKEDKKYQIASFYENEKNAINDIKNELINFKEGNIRDENYKLVATTYKELIPLIKSIQKIKNEITIN
tara:strand:- start:1305 stop:1931 length:627 start_codon:yes stop_codon:yes gene_type:complete